jgi:hypothetical protein
LVAVFEGTLSPLSSGQVCREADQVRLEHLQVVRGLLTNNGTNPRIAELSIVSLHLYWTLFLGVMAFWAQDESPNQEESLALLDQSVRLFVTTLSTNASNPERDHDA